MPKRQQKLMSFSNLFPEIIYDKEQIPNESLDIWNSYRIHIFPKSSNHRAYEKIKVRVGDTPEKISQRYYGNGRFWWIVLLSNEAEDPFTFIEEVLMGEEPYEDGRIKVLKSKYISEIMLNMRKIKNVMRREKNRN